MGRIYAMGLIFSSFLFLALPGMLYNNFTNSNLVETSEPALVCSNNDSPTDGCQGSISVGCQANSPTANPCTLNGASISFLNSKSPFTQFIQGNIFALFQNLNGPGYSGVGAQTGIFGSHGPFDQVGGSNANFYQVNCGGSPAAGPLLAQRSWQIVGCTQTYSDNSNITKADAVTWNNWNTKQSGASLTTPLFSLHSNATAPTYVFACNWLASVNYTAVAGGPGFNYFGCDLAKRSHSLAANDILNPTWSLLVAMPNNVNPTGMPAGFTHQYLFAQVLQWDTQVCFTSQATGAFNAFNSVPCQNFVNTFKGFNLPFFFQVGTNFVPNQGFAPIFSFFGALIIIMICLGIDIKTGGPGMAFNNQATKMAEVLGIGLIAWSFFYSQFSAWFTSGIFPYGFDGALGIISISLTCMFFGGIYWQLSSGGQA